MTIKKYLKPALSAVLAATFLLSSAMMANAESLDGESGWMVEFTQDKQMLSNFTSASIAEAVAGLQPGDDITFQVGLKNSNDANTEWYMSNEILYSLEDRSGTAAGGAYTYELRYISSDSVRILYSSDVLGGENVGPEGEGLHGATDALEDYLYLDTLANGQSGRIELNVGLDGETQGNSYQDTLADLKLNFAVTAAPEPTRVPGRPWTPEPQPGQPREQVVIIEESIEDEDVPRDPWIVKTGDYRDFTGPAWLMGASGFGLAALAALSILERRRAKKGGRA